MRSNGGECYGVFLEPRGDLCRFILKKKERVEEELPGQPYCSHPAHCTLIHARYSAPDMWLELLAERVGTLAPFDIRTQGVVVFHDDPLADAGHTVAVGIRRSDALFHLQLLVAESLCSFLAEAAGATTGSTLDGEMLRSCRTYGWPFVGSHWIPHFTIASLRVPRDNPLLAELSEENPEYIEHVGTVSVWRIDGDVHERIRVMELEG